ncbi:lipid II flippase MurJ [Palleronia sp.]|uniref:lipid II flippase MurJ n=1 Tax=Palleronia sp. TaxID=1940284 RepID=UPI0035C81F4F
MKRQAATVLILSFLGLIAGFSREIVAAGLFGTSIELEIFRIAFGLPSVLADSAAVSLVSLMVPRLVAGPRGVDAQRYTSLKRTMLVAGVGVVVAGVLTMPLQARLLAPGFVGEARADLVLIGRICWISSLAVILSLPLRGLMSAGGAVWPGAALQLMRSTGFVAALLLALLIGAGPLWSLALGAVGAGCVTLLVHVVAVRLRGVRMIQSEVSGGSGLDAGFAAAVVSVLLSQILLSGGRLIDRAVASSFDQGAVAALEFSYGLLMACAALFGTTASLFVAPHVTNALRAGRGVPPVMLYRVAIGLIGTLAVGLVLAAGATPLVSAVFGYGTFGAEAVAETVGFFRLHALGLMPVVAALILMQFVLVLGGHRVILGIAAGKLVIKLVALMALMAAGMGRDALATSLILSESLAALMMLAYILRGRVPLGAQPAH